MTHQRATTKDAEQYVRAAPLAEVRATGCKVVHVQGHTIALFSQGDMVYAVDNRCPHMGFPLDRGTVKDGVLTCHWHHARFDLVSGGTFDQFAGDVRAFPVQIRDGEVWVALAPRIDERPYQRERQAELGYRRFAGCLPIGVAVVAWIYNRRWKSAVKPRVAVGTTDR